MTKEKYVQVYNPLTDRWVKIDREIGKVVAHKKSTGPYKNIPQHEKVRVPKVTRKKPTGGVKVVNPNLKKPTFPTPAYRKAYEEAFGKNKRVHVISRGKKWAVLKEDKSRASRLYDKKDDAVNHANRLRNDEGYEVVIHREDGTVEKYVK